MSYVTYLLSFPFMVNALMAGTIVAVMAGVTGWFMVLRRQTFAGHTLSVIGFPGAAGAALAGVPAIVGYFLFCSVAALTLGWLEGDDTGSEAQSSAIIGTVQGAALGLGFLFVNLYHGLVDSIGALLFGTFLGITTQQVVALLLVAIISLGAIAVIARPLLFASIDPAVAQARGVRVRTMSVWFLVLLGFTVAETVQITGVLLVFALLVMPAATAQVVATRPSRSIALSVGIAVAATWLGLALAFYTDLPVGFWITTLAFVPFVLARVVHRRERGAPLLPRPALGERA